MEIKKNDKEEGWFSKMIFGADRDFRQEEIEDIVFVIARDFLLSRESIINTRLLDSDNLSKIKKMGNQRSHLNDNSSPLVLFQTLFMILDRSGLSIFKAISQSTNLPEFYYHKREEIFNSRENKDLLSGKGKEYRGSLDHRLRLSISNRSFQDQGRRSVFRELVIADLQVSPEVYYSKSRSTYHFHENSKALSIDNIQSRWEKVMNTYNMTKKNKKITDDFIMSNRNNSVRKEDTSSPSSSTKNVNDVSKMLESIALKNLEFGVQSHQNAEFKQLNFLIILSTNLRNLGISFFEGKDVDIYSVQKDMRDMFCLCCSCLWPFLKQKTLNPNHIHTEYYRQYLSFVVSPFLDDIIDLDYHGDINHTSSSYIRRNDKTSIKDDDNDVNSTTYDHIYYPTDIISNRYDDDKIYVQIALDQIRYKLWNLLDLLKTRSLSKEKNEENKNKK